MAVIAILLGCIFAVSVGIYLQVTAILSHLIEYRRDCNEREHGIRAL